MPAGFCPFGACRLHVNMQTRCAHAPPARVLSSVRRQSSAPGGGSSQEGKMKQKKKQRDILGGYSAGAPPLPIPNREVKPGRADGTAPQCGRVGRRPLFEERDALRIKSWGVPPPVFVFLCVCVCVCVCFPVVLLLPSGLSFSSGFCGRGVEGCGGAATDRTR